MFFAFRPVCIIVNAGAGLHVGHQMDSTRNTLEKKRIEWLRNEAGANIDALEAALNGFSQRNLDSLIYLRRQVKIVWEKTRASPTIAMSFQTADVLAMV